MNSDTPSSDGHDTSEVPTDASDASTDAIEVPTDVPLAIEAPASGPIEESIRIRITGAQPGAPVEFTASLEDDSEHRWRSHAAFMADDSGTVDLARAAPEDGTWSDAEAMAWLWSMQTDADARSAQFDAPALQITLRAATDTSTASRTIERERYDPDVTSLDVAHDDVVGTLFAPPDGGPAPGLIELHGAGGRRSHGTARRLATHGFTVLSLTYFGDHPTLPDELANVDLEYVDTAARWLLDHPWVSSDRLGLVGVSRGAELALLLAARRDWPGPIVSYAGSGVPWDTPSDEPAWLDDGDPVPHITADSHPNATALDEKPLADRMPPIEQANGPILLLSGGSDPVWDSRRLSQVVVDRLDDHDFAHDYQHLTFDDVGHLIGIPYSPLSGFGDYEQMQATAHASEETWPVVLDYLGRGLDEWADD